MAALVLRIKFPPTYPLIYKTLRIDANLKVSDAVTFIAHTLNIPSEANIGLYLPDEKKWLDDNLPLSSYDSLQDVVNFYNFCRALNVIHRNTSNTKVKTKNPHQTKKGAAVLYCDRSLYFMYNKNKT